MTLTAFKILEAAAKVPWKYTPTGAIRMGDGWSEAPDAIHASAIAIAVSTWWQAYLALRETPCQSTDDRYQYAVLPYRTCTMSYCTRCRTLVAMCTMPAVEEKK